MQFAGYIKGKLSLCLKGLSPPKRELRRLLRDGNNICAIRIDPPLNSLHGDPRFEALCDAVLQHDRPNCITPK
jgi:hypothetical protein